MSADILRSDLTVEDYKDVILSSVYYFVMHMNRERPKSELSWLQKLAFEKAKCFLDKTGETTLLNENESNVSMQQDIFDDIKGSGIRGSKEAVFDKFALIDDTKCINIIYSYEKELAKVLDNDCIVQPVIPSKSGGVTWGVSQMLTVVEYPNDSCFDAWKAYFSQQEIDVVTEPYYKWNTINDKVIFFWRNILVPAHELIHRHHQVSSALKWYTDKKNCTGYEGNEEVELKEFGVHPFTIEKLAEMEIGTSTLLPSDNKTTVQSGESVTYKGFSDLWLFESLNDSISYSYEQIKDFNKFIQCGCDKKLYTDVESDLAETRINPTETSQHVSSPPQLGGNINTGTTYANEFLSSAGNINVYLAYFKQKYDEATNETNKLIYQCQAVFGLLFTVELLEIIKHNIAQRDNDSIEEMELAEDFTHFAKKSGVDDKTFQTNVEGLLSGGRKNWTMTYIKHLPALEYAADFFEDHNTVKHYFDPSFWSHINKRGDPDNGFILAESEWNNTNSPQGLTVSNWITTPISCASASPGLGEGGRRHYCRSAKMRRKCNICKTRKTRNRSIRSRKIGRRIKRRHSYKL